MQTVTCFKYMNCHTSEIVTKKAQLIDHYIRQCAGDEFLVVLPMSGNIICMQIMQMAAYGKCHGR